MTARSPRQLLTRPLAVQSCNTASKLQAVYLRYHDCKQQRQTLNRCQFSRHCLGLLDDLLTPQPRRRRGFVSHATNATAARESASICYAVNLSKSAQRCCVQTDSACSQGGDGGGACSQTTQRGPVWHDVNHAATDPCISGANNDNAERPAAQYMQRQADYANTPRFALYRPCGIALYPPRATHCKSCKRPFQTV